VIHEPLIAPRGKLREMRSSGVVGGGRCVKRGGYVITLFREGLDGPPIFKVQPLVNRCAVWLMRHPLGAETSSP